MTALLRGPNKAGTGTSIRSEPVPELLGGRMTVIHARFDTSPALAVILAGASLAASIAVAQETTSNLGKEESRGAPPAMRAWSDRTGKYTTNALMVGFENGAVRLRKVVKTETVNQPVELKREEIVVERTSADDPNAIPAAAFREGEVTVPLKREEAVVEKTAHVTGEVKVQKTAESDTHQVRETVRKEDLKVENEGPNPRRTEP